MKTQTTKSNYEIRYERMKKFIQELGEKENQEAKKLYLAIWNDEYMDWAIRPYCIPWGCPSWTSKLFYRVRTNRFVKAWRIAKYV
jgi:hypothetical protein